MAGEQQLAGCVTLGRERWTRDRAAAIAPKVAMTDLWHEIDPNRAAPTGVRTIVSRRIRRASGPPRRGATRTSERRPPPACALNDVPVRCLGTKGGEGQWSTVRVAAP